MVTQVFFCWMYLVAFAVTRASRYFKDLSAS